MQSNSGIFYDPVPLMILLISDESTPVNLLIASIAIPISKLISHFKVSEKPLENSGYAVTCSVG